MNKLFLIAFAAVAALSSCKKDYNCTEPVSGQTVVVDNASKSDIDKLENAGYKCDKR